MSLVLCSCGVKTISPENEYTLPDIKGKTFVEAIAAIGGNLNLVSEYVPTNETYPNYVLGYKNHNSGDVVEKKSSITLLVASQPTNAYSYDSKVAYVSEICSLTGPKSVNKDLLLEAGIFGTDLGFPVDLGDKMIYLFGDTFSGSDMSGRWYSNFVATSTDKTLYDDLIFDSVTTKENGMAKAFAEGAHQKGNKDDKTVEVTKIPTGGIKIGEYVYIFYMSIRYWGEAGFWTVTYNQVVRSRDLNTFEEVQGLRWDEDEAPNFGQIYPYRDPNSNYIYIYGIEGGRNGGLMVGRTTEANFLNKDEYEYQTAKGVWTKGSEGLASLKENPYYLINPTVSEMTVQYNAYLGKYTIIFYRNSKIIMMASDTPDGNFKDPITLTTASEYNGIYGGLTCDALLMDGGKSFYMVVSCWQVYNTYFVKVVLN